MYFVLIQLMIDSIWIKADDTYLAGEINIYKIVVSDAWLYGKILFNRQLYGIFITDCLSVGMFFKTKFVPSNKTFSMRTSVEQPQCSNSLLPNRLLQ